jgi:cytoskeleton protein RodZ
VPTGAIVLLGVVLVLVGYGLWYRHTEQEARLAAEIPSVPAELAPLAVPPKPPAPVVQAAQPKVSVPAPAPAPAAVPPATAAQAVAPTSPPPATATAAVAKPAAPLIAPPPPPQPAAQAVAAQAAAAPAAVNQIQPASVAIMATGDSWVQVTDPKGNILFSKTLHAGDSWPVPDLPGLVMTAGNAGNTVIADNGKAGSPVGAAGTVLRNYSLTPPAPSPTAPASTN